MRDDGVTDTSTSAPLPHLGYTIDSVGHVRDRRTQNLARVALVFAIVSILLSIIVIGWLVVETAHTESSARHRDRDITLGLMLFLCPLCMLLGLLFGGVTKKTRTGRAAIFLSLAPIGIAAVAFVGTMIVAFFVGIARGLKH